MKVTNYELRITSYQPLEVRAPGGETYPILMGSGLLDHVGEVALGRGLGPKVVVATDSIVAPLYGDKVIAALQRSGFEAAMAVMLPGEPHKRWEAVSGFVDAFASAGLSRDGWVLALGGGVVGDTAGFAASIYMRGVPLAQAPTTLLAMADSSIGGKVGVDHPAGKNLVGTFKQPEFVLADLETLATLPALQISCGMAEIIKAALIGDPELFAYMERSDPGEQDMQTVLRPALLVKRGIVERDPFEQGERAHLNLGHTFGHAFESCTGYARPHGVAVAQGMSVAFNLAGKLGVCDPEDGERLRNVLDKWDLPSHWGAPDLLGGEAPDRVYSAMLGDKKRKAGQMRLVLPETIGRVTVVQGVARELVVQALAELH